MTGGMRKRLEAMLEAGREDALLRFSLGEICLKDGDAEAAVDHLERALELDREYSAAWKIYGRALSAANRREAAAEAFERGIAVAEEHGDKQAAKEMRVFLKKVTRKDDR